MYKLEFKEPTECMYCLPSQGAVLHPLCCVTRSQCVLWVLQPEFHGICVWVLGKTSQTVSFFRAGEALVSRMVQVVISLVVGFFFFFFLALWLVVLVFFLVCLFFALFRTSGMGIRLLTLLVLSNSPLRE